MEPTRKKKVFSVLIIAFLIALVLKTFVFETFVVSGDSMLPTVVDGDHVFINKLAYVSKGPKRGDVVVALSRAPEYRIIKRIIGLPGERVDIADGKVAIRVLRTDPVVPLEEKYLELPDSTNGTTTIKLDPEEYFALGDNRQVSIDSRILGPLDLWDIQGKVIFTINLKTLKIKGF